MSTSMRYLVKLTHFYSSTKFYSVWALLKLPNMIMYYLFVEQINLGSKIVQNSINPQLNWEILKFTTKLQNPWLENTMEEDTKFQSNFSHI